MNLILKNIAINIRIFLLLAAAKKLNIDAAIAGIILCGVIPA